jgi:hypothetical protein
MTVDGTKLALLMVGIFFLAYGLVAYRFFFAILGGTAGLVSGVLLLPSLLRIPILAGRETEATLVLLLLLLLAGILLIHLLRKPVIFLGGAAAGILLSHFAGGGLAAAPELFSRVPRLGEIHAIDALVGILLGVMFLVFESLFAVVLTSFAGAFLCAWGLGGKWTFPAAFVLGLALQPLLARYLPLPAHSHGGVVRKGRRKEKDED